MMLTTFRKEKMEWMLSCAFAIQGLRLICCSVHANPLAGSLKTFSLDKIFSSDEMSMASWTYLLLVPSFAMFRSWIIQGVAFNEKIEKKVDDEEFGTVPTATNI